jgi:hypothetical protein
MNESEFSYSQFVSVGEEADEENSSQQEHSSASNEPRSSLLEPMPLPQRQPPMLKGNHYLNPNPSNAQEAP